MFHKIDAASYENIIRNYNLSGGQLAYSQIASKLVAEK